ncbi:unnamed protein product [Brachionus calyciflorus]|uniref:Large ribosomal subunit protein bL19m n=1 Tax=Brachionus calyciflorus TaxID=104777 RepID=A0A813RUU7_9BILA|nr:unnamed protein product [Brachionus calyciflorus]
MIKIYEKLPNLLRRNTNSIKQTVELVLSRNYTNTVPDKILEKARRSRLGAAVKGPAVQIENEPKLEQANKYTEAERDYKYIYPDFLPNPVYYFRDKIRERLERNDMLNRRKQITIPEFYVGSILAVTVSDPYAPGKTNRFVGICIRRDDYGLRHSFTLRNVVDGLGVEILYDMYNPTIQTIEVLKLEKRLDDNLSYLQDCPPEYSTIPFDLQPVKLLPGMKVPVNTTKVPLKKKPWRHAWDRKSLRGVILPEIKRYEHEEYMQSTSEFKPYQKWDLMKNYRETIHDDDHREIIQDIKKFESEITDKREVITAAKKLVRTRNIPSENSTPNK